MIQFYSTDIFQLELEKVTPCKCVYFYIIFFCSLEKERITYTLHIGFIVLPFSPKLSWRDIQHLAVLTSKRNSLFDAKGRFHWTMNGVGLEFNHLFGFGVLDAGAMVALAKRWKTVPPRYHCEAGSLNTIK